MLGRPDFEHSRLRHAGVTARDHRPCRAVGFSGAQPRILRELHAARIPHLPVRFATAPVSVGPLALAGVMVHLSSW